MTREALTAALAGCAVVALILAQARFAPVLLPITGALALVVALLLEWREKRSRARKLAARLLYPHNCSRNFHAS